MKRLAMLFALLLLFPLALWAQTPAFTPTCITADKITLVNLEASAISNATGLDLQTLSNFLLKEADFICGLAAEENNIASMQASIQQDEANIATLSQALANLTTRVQALEAKSGTTPPPPPPPPGPTPSADGTTCAPGAGCSITDPSGHVWGFAGVDPGGRGSIVTEDGTATQSACKLLLLFNGAMDCNTNSGAWWGPPNFSVNLGKDPRT